MSNEYFTPTGNPASSSTGSSALMRAEFNSIQAAFDKLPTLTGNGSKLVSINSGGTALEVAAQTGTGNVVRANSPTLGGGVTETVYAISGTTPAIDPDNGTVQTWTLTGNSSPTLSFDAGQSITLMVAPSASYAITWPVSGATITWLDTVAGTVNATKTSVMVLWKTGSTIYGAFMGVA